MPMLENMIYILVSMQTVDKNIDFSYKLWKVHKFNYNYEYISLYRKSNCSILKLEMTKGRNGNVLLD